MKINGSFSSFLVNIRIIPNIKKKNMKKNFMTQGKLKIFDFCSAKYFDHFESFLKKSKFPSSKTSAEFQSF